jgi:hypothetical protein
MKEFGAIWVMLGGLVLGQAQGHFSYSILLSGWNERPVPAMPSLATGIADISLDILPNFTTVAWNIRWTGLSGLPTAANFHGPAGPEASAAVLFSLGNFFSDSTPNSGGYSGFRQLSDSTQISAIRDGRAYVNIRTESYAEGEIRGHLQAVSEPSTISLIAFVAAATSIVTVWRNLPGQNEASREPVSSL